MKKLVENYDSSEVTSIKFFKVGHTISGTDGIVLRRTSEIINARISNRLLLNTFTQAIMKCHSFQPK